MVIKLSGELVADGDDVTPSHEVLNVSSTNDACANGFSFVAWLAGLGFDPVACFNIT